MKQITRRAALTAIPAMGAVAIVPAQAEPITELPSEKVVRLARELSQALDELNHDAFTVDYGGDEVGIWIARVWPSKVNPHVCLEQKDIPAALARFAATI